MNGLNDGFSIVTDVVLTTPSIEQPQQGLLFIHSRIYIAPLQGNYSEVKLIVVD